MQRLRQYMVLVLVIGIAVSAYIAWRVGADDVIRLLLIADKSHLLIYLLASVLIAVFLTLKWMVVMHAQGANVPFHRLFAYRLVGYSVNYLTPTMHVGSEPVRAYLLKREGIPTHTAVSNVIIDKSVELATNILFFLIGGLIILSSAAVTHTTKIIVLGVAIGSAVAMTLFIVGILGKRQMLRGIFRTFRLHKIKRWRGVERSLTRIERGIEEFYRRRPKHFLLIVGLMVILWGLMWLEYRSLLLFLGHEATAAQILLILTGVGIAYSIPVPAAMGTLELGQLSATKVLDLGGVTGITLAVLIRTRDLLWTAIGLGCMAAFHFRFRPLAKQTVAIDKEFERGELLEKKG